MEAQISSLFPGSLQPYELSSSLLPAEGGMTLSTLPHPAEAVSEGPSWAQNSWALEPPDGLLDSRLSKEPPTHSASGRERVMLRSIGTSRALGAL